MMSSFLLSARAVLLLSCVCIMVLCPLPSAASPLHDPQSASSRHEYVVDATLEARVGPGNIETITLEEQLKSVDEDNEMGEGFQDHAETREQEDMYDVLEVTLEGLDEMVVKSPSASEREGSSKKTVDQSSSASELQISKMSNVQSPHLQNVHSMTPIRMVHRDVSSVQGGNKHHHRENPSSSSSSSSVVPSSSGNHHHRHLPFSPSSSSASSSSSTFQSSSSLETPSSSSSLPTAKRHLPSASSSSLIRDAHMHHKDLCPLVCRTCETYVSRRWSGLCHKACNAIRAAADDQPAPIGIGFRMCFTVWHAHLNDEH